MTNPVEEKHENQVNNIFKYKNELLVKIVKQKSTII